MSYRVRTDNFEGPFDLLLYLVSNDRVDVGAVRIADIVDQYLAELSRLKDVDLDVASDFLLVASTLLEMKAQRLIPRDEDDDDEQIADLTPSEAFEVLVGRLTTYKQYRNVAEDLEERAAAQARLHPRTAGPDRDFLHAMPDFLKGVTLESLAQRAASAYARRDAVILEAEHIAAKPIPVETHVRRLYERLTKGESMKFSDLVKEDPSTTMIVVNFLAVLELYKRSIVEVVQDDQFGDISIVYRSDAPELTFDGMDEY